VRNWTSKFPFSAGIKGTSTQKQGDGYEKRL